MEICGEKMTITEMQDRQVARRLSYEMEIIYLILHCEATKNMCAGVFSHCYFASRYNQCAGKGFSEIELAVAA